MDEMFKIKRIRDHNPCPINDQQFPTRPTMSACAPSVLPHVLESEILLLLFVEFDTHKQKPSKEVQEISKRAPIISHPIRLSN